MFRLSIVLLVASMAAACGNKQDKAGPPAGSAAGSATAAGSAAGSAAAAGAATGSGSAAEMGSATGSATAMAGVDPCSFAKRDDIEKAIGPISGELTKPPTSGSTLGRCYFELANLQVTIDARPVAEFDTTSASDKKATTLAGVGETALASDSYGVIVKVAGKPYFLHVKAEAGAGQHENKSAAALATLLVTGAK